MSEYKIVKLDGGHAFSLEGRAMNVSNEPMDHVTFIDQYEISTADLAGFNVMVVTDFIDQEHLYEHKQLIENFLNEGKIIIANTIFSVLGCQVPDCSCQRKLNHMRIM